MSTSRKLTLKQQRFVNELPLASSATEAAIKAGYSASTHHVAESLASKTLSNVEVQKALASIQNAATSQTIATVSERKERLSSFLRAAKPENVAVHDAISASDQLNRMENLYISKSINLNVDVDEELAQFTLEELQMMLNEAKRRKEANHDI